MEPFFISASVYDQSVILHCSLPAGQRTSATAFCSPVLHQERARQAHSELRDLQCLIMASGLLSSLPQPVKEYAPVSMNSSPESTTTTLVSQTHFEPPPYGSAERRKFVPRKPRDFGDGGVSPLHRTSCHHSSMYWH